MGKSRLDTESNLARVPLLHDSGLGRREPKPSSNERAQEQHRDSTERAQEQHRDSTAQGNTFQPVEKRKEVTKSL